MAASAKKPMSGWTFLKKSNAWMEKNHQVLSAGNRLDNPRQKSSPGCWLMEQGGDLGLLLRCLQKCKSGQMMLASLPYLWEGIAWFPFCCFVVSRQRCWYPICQRLCDEPWVTVLLNAGTDVLWLAAFSIWWQEGTRPTEIDYFFPRVFNRYEAASVLWPVFILFNSLSFSKANKNQGVNKEDKNLGIIP